MFYPKYVLRVPGTDTVIRRCWTIGGAHRAHDRLFGKDGLRTEFAVVRWVD